MAHANSSSSPTPPQAGLWRFGKAVLDEQMATLRVGDATVDLDRSSYDVLLALLRHAGEVVTKDELLEAGWPGRAVSENSLAKAVSRLRQALGEDGELIRVVHGYGYRLAAAVAFQALAAQQVRAHPHDASHLHEGDPLPHRPGWRLVRRLGEGGAGVIFLARCEAGEDAGAERAVKFANGEAGLLSLKREISLARYFRAATEELPDVVPVLDWNLSQPPFFLELPHFPQGNLADWANAAGGLAPLSRRQRVALCAQLCETVAGLHEIGVIHKDLKPENLYPRADGDGQWRVMLSDLGAGEAQQSPRLAELGITLSLAADPLSQRAGSLLYLAPEVIAGEMPTQRSDVFALGVLVYQIVVGDLRRSLAPGWEVEIDDELLREDIALAAAANPLRREVDARALAQRLRSLEARGVQRAAARLEEQRTAQREHDLQRERSRRRIWLAAATASALGLVGTLGMYTYAERARRAAERNAQQRQALVDFVTKGVLQQADPFAGGNAAAMSLHDAVDRAAKDVDARFGDSPDVAAAIHGTLGATYEGMNDFNAAVAHYRAQLSALRRGPTRDPAAIARASVDVCSAQIWQGDLTRILPACEQARAAYVAAGLEPDRPEVFLALVDSRQNRLQRGLARLEPRLDRIRRSGDDDLLGFADWFASILYARLGRITDAERTSAELVEVRRRQSGEGMQLAWALTEHGRHLLLLGRVDEGKAQLERGRRMFVKAAGAGHPQSYAPAIHLSAHELALGRWQQARELAEPAYRTLLRETSWDHWTIYAALNTIAATAELKDREAAHRVMAEFDAMASQGLDDDFPYLREPHWVAYAQAHLALGEYAQAERYIDQLKRLAAEDQSGVLLRARLACLEGRLQLAQGLSGPALANARACRRDAISATSPDSPLLAIPDRLMAALGQKP